MSYTKKTWVMGDVITPDALNNLENGVEAATFPDYDVSNAGMVLGIDSNGDIAWLDLSDVAPDVEPIDGEE